MQQEYHVIARIEGNEICVSALLNKTNPPRVPTTFLNFQPLKFEPAQYPVFVYWKSTLPNDPEMARVAEQAILNYCARLYHESVYSGPVDCCL